MTDSTERFRHCATLHSGFCWKNLELVDGLDISSPSPNCREYPIAFSRLFWKMVGVQLQKTKTMLFTKTLLQKMLQAALSAVENQLAMLNQLDAATGDGDHGTAILAAMKAATAAAQKEGTLKTTLETIGWDVMSNTSSSTSALMGSFFIGMSQVATGEELDALQTITIFESGLANLRTSSRANVGDKTKMDALIPAIEAMSSLKGQSPSLPDIFSAAADAAQKGADSTKDLVAKFGRAKNLGERSRGTLDAGAVSTALIYRAYADAVAGH